MRHGVRRSEREVRHVAVARAYDLYLRACEPSSRKLCARVEQNLFGSAPGVCARVRSSRKTDARRSCHLERADHGRETQEQRDVRLGPGLHAVDAAREHLVVPHQNPLSGIAHVGADDVAAVLLVLAFGVPDVGARRAVAILGVPLDRDHAEFRIHLAQLFHRVHGVPGIARDVEVHPDLVISDRLEVRVRGRHGEHPLGPDVLLDDHVEDAERREDGRIGKPSVQELRVLGLDVFSPLDGVKERVFVGIVQEDLHAAFDREPRFRDDVRRIRKRQPNHLCLRRSCLPGSCPFPSACSPGPSAAQRPGARASCVRSAPRWPPSLQRLRA